MDSPTRKLINGNTRQHDARSFGIVDFDRSVDSGVSHGETRIVAGGVGSGKTTLGMHFLAQGIAVGETGLYISSTENPARMLRYFSEFWPDLKTAVTDKQLAILDPSPFFYRIATKCIAKESSTSGELERDLAFCARCC